MNQNQTLRLKRKGNRLGPGLIGQLNRHTNNAAKMLEELSTMAKKSSCSKVLIQLIQNPAGDTEARLSYPGDAQVLRTLEDPSLEALNSVRRQYGRPPLLHESTLQGIKKSML